MDSHSPWRYGRGATTFVLPLLCVSALWGCAEASVSPAGHAQAPRPSLSSYDTQVSVGSDARQQIDWREWSGPPFERAKSEDKLILLDLTAVWCHACHVMDETTYTDPAVIQAVNARFVPIRVDTDRHPDIESRYRHGGWPTTSVLMHSGEILFQANFLEPDGLLAVLAETDAYYREQKGPLKERAAAVWAAVEAASSRPPLREQTVKPGYVDHSLTVLRASFDARHGGFREAPKFFEPDAIEFAFLQFHRTGQEDLKQMALKTLDGQIRLEDPLWGGFYRYAEHADWSKPHYEKVLEVQASNLLNYLEAYQVTGDDRYRAVAVRIVQYVNRFLTSEDGEAFFSSQDASVRGRGPGARSVDGAEYYALGEKERLAIGMPFVDTSVYTSSNSLMVKSLLKASSVLGEPNLQQVALRVLDRLFAGRYRVGSGVVRLVRLGELKGEGEREGEGLLVDHVSFAEALVATYLATGDAVYLQRATMVVEDLARLLEDRRGGGFFDRVQRPSDQGLLRVPHKPLDLNLRASILSSNLFYLTRDRIHHDRAERTLAYVLGAGQPLPVALSGSAVDRFLTYPVHVVIVGPKRSERTAALLVEARGLYAPGKIVRLLDPLHDSLWLGDITFPRSDRAQAYVCTDRFCSKPVEDPAQLQRSLDEVLAAASQEPPAS